MRQETASEKNSTAKTLRLIDLIERHQLNLSTDRQRLLENIHLNTSRVT